MKIFLSLPPFCLGWNSRPSLWIRMPNGPERRRRGRNRRRNKTIVHEQYSRVQYTQVRSSLSAEEIGSWNWRTAKRERGEDSNWPSFTDEKIRKEKKEKGGISIPWHLLRGSDDRHRHVSPPSYLEEGREERRKGWLHHAACILRSPPPFPLFP